MCVCKPEWQTPWFLGQLLKDFICTYCDVPQLRGCFDTLITTLATPLVSIAGRLTISHIQNEIVGEIICQVCKSIQTLIIPFINNFCIRCCLCVYYYYYYTTTTTATTILESSWQYET